MKIPSTTEGRLENLSQTIWALEEAHRTEPLPPLERLNLLRSHYEIQQLREEELEIPKKDRSFLYLNENSKVQVLLVHGGHSTPASFIQLGKRLYRAGMTVYATLLPNEETVGFQRGGVPWQLSRAELEMRYDLLHHLGENTHVVGSSFGAVLAIGLAKVKPVKSLVLLSPPLRPTLRFAERMALTWKKLFPQLFENMVESTPHRWMADRYTALRVARKTVKELNCPILAIHARNNMELDHRGLELIRRHARNKTSKALLLDEGGHKLLHGKSGAKVEEEILSYIQAQS